MKVQSTPLEKATKMITKWGGTIRSRDAISNGIQPRTIREMMNAGKLEQLSRGLYRLANSEPVSDPDLFTIGMRIPKGVICLISALHFHDLTTQIPRQVYVALEKGAESPRLKYPPLSIHRFSGEAFHEGIEEHFMDGIHIKIYNPEKTLADCFKFRNQIGMDVVIEALKFYRSKKKFNMKAMSHYARICHVENVMKPYLETIV